MSVAAANARKFYEQVVAERRVFTFVDDGSYLVFKIGGAEVIPFWSHRSHLDSVQEFDPKFLSYEPDEISLEDFLAKTLPQLDREKIRVGVNWSGSRLTGYDLTVDELKRNLNYWIANPSS